MFVEVLLASPGDTELVFKERFELCHDAGMLANSVLPLV